MDKGGTITQTKTTIAAKASTNPSSLTKTNKVKKLKETFVAKPYDKTIKLAKSIVENSRRHLLSWQLLGAYYQSIGDRSAALAAYEQALAICPGDAASVCNMAILHLELKDISQAQLGFQKALSLKSNWSVAQNGLGSTYLALGDNSNAEKCFLTALTLEPNHYDALVSLGALYKEKGRAKESEEYLRKAISIQPRLPFAKYSLGILLKHMGKFEAAITLLDGLDYKDSEQTLVMCLYLSGKKEQFRERLELSKKRGEVNTIVGSLGSRAEARYRWDKPNLFCKEPLDYVDKTSLLGKCDFNKLFVRPALDILGTAASKEHQSILTNELQTAGNIFELEKDLMSPVEEIIRSEVQLYLEKHCESEEGLMRHWPSHYSLYGWFISMQRGGGARCSYTRVGLGKRMRLYKRTSQKSGRQR
ncbi:tetratricopeptide repeat protein [Gammaproteobacteria bacterium]|nr:tetratricopeptide repeat protein [Gammaproteobacteria bacterium]